MPRFENNGKDDEDYDISRDLSEMLGFNVKVSDDYMKSESYAKKIKEKQMKKNKCVV